MPLSTSLSLSVPFSATSLRESQHRPSGMMQQKFLKRTAEDLDSAGSASSDGVFGEPSVKLQCTQSLSASVPHHGHTQHQTGNAASNPGSSNNPGGPVPGLQSQPPGNQGGAGNNGGNTTEGLTKFSVEIVQQLEFTTSAANSQAQQISTNVTVKALTNASVKSDHVNASTSPKTEPKVASNGPASAAPSASAAPVPTSNTADIINSLVECKQEPDNDFDLEQCAAALEKDPCFPGFVVDFMGDEAADDDAFKDLISEISDFHPQMDFIKDLDFEEKVLEGSGNCHIKLEDDKEQAHAALHTLQHQQHQHQQQQQQQQQPLGSTQYSSATRLPYSGLDFKSEMSPAAQTLKQMAEQHQHKNQQLGIPGYNPAAARGPSTRSPYTEFGQFGSGPTDFLGSPAQSGGGYPKHNGSGHGQASMPFQPQQSDVFGQQPQFDMGKRPVPPQQPTSGTQKSSAILGSAGPGYKQQYTSYGSPGSLPNHGSPGYPLPPRISQSQGAGQGSGPQGGFNNSTPPRPPSGSGNSTIQINQAQQLLINNPTHQIQVSAGQHMQLTSDLKPGNVTVAAQQGMYFNQQQQQQQQQQQGVPVGSNEAYCTVSQSQTINFTQQSLRQRASAGPGPGGTVPAQQTPRQHPGQQQASSQVAQQQQVPCAQVSEQHAKLLQQQQMLRAQAMQQHQQHQHQQQQHMAVSMGGGIVRPPPPEYKTAQAQLMHSGIGMGQQSRFANASAIRRVTQQPMPPSGPMMRPQMAQQTSMHTTANSMYMAGGGVGTVGGVGVVGGIGGVGGIGMGLTSGSNATVGGGMSTIGGLHQIQQRLGYPRTNNQRPPNINIGPPDTLGNGVSSRGNTQNWQNIFIQQQQHHQGNFGMSTGGGIQISATQMQHQQLMRSQGGAVIPGTGMTNTALQQQIIVSQQQQQQQQANNQMGMQLQMSQSQSVSTVAVTSGSGTGSMHPHQQYGAGNPSARSTLQSQIQPPPQPQQQQHTDSSVNTADLGFDFLDNLQTGDASNFNPQELLNSLDSSFNLDSIL